MMTGAASVSPYATDIHPILKRDGVNLTFSNGRYTWSTSGKKFTDEDRSAIARAVAALNDPMGLSIAERTKVLPPAGPDCPCRHCVKLYTSAPPTVYPSPPTKSAESLMYDEYLRMVEMRQPVAADPDTLSARVSSAICQLDALRDNLRQIKALL